MGRGGVQFLARGDRNPKKSFFTFNFDEHITSDQKELDAMNTVNVIKSAALQHGKKTFRGSVVVNLTLDDLANIQNQLKVRTPFIFFIFLLFISANIALKLEQHR